MRLMRSMKFQSGVVLETLQGLEQQLAAHRSHLAQMASSLSGGLYAAALEAADKLRDALGLVVAMYQRLHANVVPADDLGEVESIDELALRARRMVIVTQLSRLRDVLADPAAEDRAYGWFVGRFEGIDDVTAYFDEQFSKINGIWMQYRHSHALGTGMSTNDRVTLYHAAVRVAQQALADLKDDPDLAYFRRAGIAMTNWPEVHTAFREIDAALAVQIDMESGRLPLALLAPLSPSRAPEATPHREP